MGQMAIEAQQMLIRTGENLNSWGKDIVYDLPVEFIGFKDLSLVRVALNDTADVKTLIPDFDYRPQKYAATEAVCVLEAGEPVLAVVKGEDICEFSLKDKYGYYRDVTERYPMRSIVNLSRAQEKVILTSSKTRPLENIGSYWPGYSISGHKKNLELGLETISVKKSGDKVVISFPEEGEQFRAYS